MHGLARARHEHDTGPHEARDAARRGVLGESSVAAGG